MWKCLYCRQRAPKARDIVHTTGYAFDYQTYKEFIGACNGSYEIVYKKPRSCHII